MLGILSQWAATFVGMLLSTVIVLFAHADLARRDKRLQGRGGAVLYVALTISSNAAVAVFISRLPFWK